jgi:sugar lactone lactonase YvrE
VFGNGWLRGSWRRLRESMTGRRFARSGAALAALLTAAAILASGLLGQGSSRRGPRLPAGELSASLGGRVGSPQGFAGAAGARALVVKPTGLPLSASEAPRHRRGHSRSGAATLRAQGAASGASSDSVRHTPAASAQPGNKSVALAELHGYRNRPPVPGISSKPSKTEPYWVCPHSLCESIIVPHPTKKVGARWIPAAGGPAYEGGGEFGGYSPQDLQSAYNVFRAQGGTVDPAEESKHTIAVVDAGGYTHAEEDLAKWRERYGLPKCTRVEKCLQLVNQEGKEENYPSSQGWEVEAALDLDMVSAACPYCHLILMETNSNYLNDLAAGAKEAAELGATEVSSSYGGDERYVREYAPGLDADYVHKGVMFFAAAGDGGFMGYLYPNDYLWHPAAIPTEISAGGTALHRASNARGWSEETWWATGGGCSLGYPKPAWQLDSGCKNRVDNDASAVASPQTPVSVYVTPHKSKESEEHAEWWLLGGTSASSPLLAGIEAHATAFAYSLPGAEAFYSDPSAFYDVTEGDNAPNGECEFTYLCNAGAGWDAPTGVGSPDGPLTLTSLPPLVETSAASAVAETAATLNGALDPQGAPTSYYFQYGTSAAYGSSTATTSAGSGNTHLSPATPLTGLKARTTYHDRLVAVSAGKTYYGHDSVFRTAVPTVAHVAPASGSPGGETSVTITGTNFAGVTEVHFGSKRTSFHVNSETTITATSPSGSGTVDVTVSTPAGTTSTSAADHFRYEHLLWKNGELTSPNEGSWNFALNGVSCVSSAWCMSVGEHQYLAYPYPHFPDAQVWSGGKWTVQPLAVPGGSQANVSEPLGTTVDSRGNVWVTDSGHSRVVEYSPAGVFMMTFGWGVKDGKSEAETCTESCQAGIAGSGAGQLNLPWSIAFAPNGDLWIVDSENHRVQQFTAEGKYVQQFTSSGMSAGTLFIKRLAIDREGHVWVSEPGSNQVEEFNETGASPREPIRKITGLNIPTGIAIDGSGNVWVAEEGAARLEEYASTGAFIRTTGWGVKDGKSEAETCTESCQAGIAGTGNGQFDVPKGVVVDENGTVWVTNAGSGSIQEFKPEANEVKFVRVFTNTEGAQAIAVGNGMVYVDDSRFAIVDAYPITAAEGLALDRFTVPATSALNDVSCSTENTCMAVGAFRERALAGEPGEGEESRPFAEMAERWNGHQWAIQSLPSVSGAKRSELNSVSCVSANECVAVGDFEEGSGTTVPYAALWRNGTWSLQSAPEPNEGGKSTRLLHLSCVSPTFCMAVGTRRENGYPEYGRAFAESWNGTSWTIVETPELSNWFSGLGGISCTSPSMCLAVGQYYNSGFVDLVERWNGTAWSQETASPRDGEFQNGWGGVSCTTPESCTLVGNYELHHGGPWVTGVQTWNGRSWTNQITPAATGAESSGLGAVSCVGEAACAAVGVDSAFYSTQRAETRAETAMAVQTVSQPTGATQGALSGSSCPSSGPCMAVGSYRGSAGTSLSLAEEWTGFEWKSQATPNPSGATGTELHHVSCTGPSACTAVGSYKSSSGTTQTLAERLGGSEWQLQTTPNPAGAQESKLSGVSCTSTSSCYAAGYYKSSAGVLTGLAEYYNGSEWQLQPVPVPQGATSSKLYDISCAAQGACTAAGSYTNASGEMRGLAESYNGSEWQVQSTPNPAGAKNVELAGVSCPAEGTCTAVGSYTTAQGKSESLAEGYSAGGWQLEAIEGPTGVEGTNLSGVSCAALGACTAVGSSTSVGGAHAPLSELWSGHEWHGLPAPSPSGSEAGELLSVSCLNVDACESVGGYSSSKVQTPLAEGLGAPGASTKSASVAGDAVTLTGLVNPNRWQTRYYFEYGETPSYGSTTPSEQLISETGAEEVQALASGLKAGGTYYFRLVAQNAGGTTYSHEQTVVAANPVITEVKPNSGPQAGGTKVTIAGSGFSGTSAVEFGQTPAQSFEVESESKITAVAPTGSGSVDITLSSPSVTSATGPADKFTYLAPEITEVTPNSGPQSGGTQVTITGANLAGATGVKFGQTPAQSFEVESESKITAVAPAGSGTVEISVSTAGGSSAPTSADRFTYVSPEITEVTPTSGPEGGGTQVTISGTHLLSGVTGVSFGRNSATSFKVESETKITATSPPGAGTVDITVSTAGGSSPTGATDKFAYESVTPTFKSAFGEAGSGAGQLSSPQGVAVDSGGNVWVSERANNRVDEFGPEGKFKLAFGWGVKDGKEEAEVCSEACRAGTAGSGPGQLHEPAGIATEGGRVWVVDSANSRVEEFSSAGVYLNKQIVSGSAAYPTAPNDVALDGHGDMFVTGTPYGSLQKFSIETGEQLAQVLTYTTGYSPQFGVAVDQQGNVWVADYGSNRVREFSNNLELKLTLGWGVKDGEAKLETCTSECKVGLSGSGIGEFTNPNGIAIDGENTLWVVDSGNNRVERFNLEGEYLTQFGSAGSGPGQLSGPWGIAATNGSLYIADTANNRVERWTTSPVTPVITAVTPSAGLEAGGTHVTITGAGFTGASAVSFGEHSASSFEVVSASTIKATAPAGMGTVDVKVTSAGGTSATSAADKFGYASVPTVTGISPRTGSEAGGTKVTITGAGFVSGATTVAFGEAQANGVEVISSTEVKATSPGGKGTADITVSSAGGTSAASSADRFTYVPAPTVTGVQPNFGPSAGGTQVTITGTNFVGVTGVSFGQTPAPGFKVESETTITTTSPPGVGTVDVTVTAQGGPSATGPADTFAYESLAPILEGTFGEAGSGAGQLSGPRGVAVDATGNVWVTDRANNRVDEFSPTGEFKLAFGWGVKDGGEKLETCSKNCRAGLTGSGPGEFGGLNLYDEALAGIAIEGADIWIADAGNSRLEEFTTSGEYVEQIVTLLSPDSIAIDSSGNVWVHDYGYGDVQEFSTTSGQQLRTFNTAYEFPAGMALDSQGNVWLASERGERIEEYSSEGTFKLAFGWGVKDGEAKLETCTTECKSAITGSGNGQFNDPTAITTDGRNGLWVVDAGNNRVQQFTLSGEYLTQFGASGSGPGQLSAPQGIAATANGSLYVADTGNNRIERWEPLPPVITGLEPSSGSEAGGTTVTIHGYDLSGARAVRFGGKSATGVTVKSETEVTAISPPGSGTVDVTVVTSEGTTATSSADRFTYFPPPTVTAVQPNFGPPAGGTQVAISGTKFVGVTGVSFGQSAATSFKVESETKITATSPAGAGTVDVVVTAEGGASTTTAPDTFAYESIAPLFNSSFGEAGSGTGELSSPVGIAVDASGNEWVTDPGNNRVDEFSPTGAFKLALGWGVKDGAEKLETCTESCRAGLTGSGNGEFGGPESHYGSHLGGIAAAGGNIWVLDSGNERLLEFTESGEYLKQIGGVLIGADGLATDAAGNLYVSDYGYGGVQVFSPTSGEQLRLFYPAGGAQLYGVAVDAQGNVWTTAAIQHRIQESSPEGAFKMAVGWGVKDGAEKLETCTTECKSGMEGSGIGQLSEPTGIAVDGLDTIWVVDPGNDRVERFNPAGEYLTQLGSRGTGAGQLSGPQDAAATKGALYIADTGNNRIERWTLLAPVITGVQPSTGSEAGGTAVTIHGYGFSGVRAVRFGEKLASGFTVKSETEITATAPAGIGTVEVAVITSEGATAAVSGDKFTYAAVPTVTSIAPTAGPTAGGTKVTITGTGFVTGQTTVAFGSTAGTSVEVISATEAKATSPAGSAGTVDVKATTAGGTSAAVSGDKFTYTAAPTVETKPASAILQTVATLNATVNPNGLTVSKCEFEYGTSISYGKTALCTTSPGSGTSAVAVSAAITGLSAKTTYHYRISAMNSAGTSKGSDSSFTTLAAPSFTSNIGSSGSGSGQIKGPAGIAIDAKGNIWVADSANNRVDEFTSTGTFTKAFGWGVSNGKLEAQTCTTSCKAGLAGSGNGEFKKPWGIAMAPTGEILVSDVENNRVEEFSSEGAYVRQFGTKGTGNGQFSEPAGLATLSNGNIWVADATNNRVEEFSSEGKYVTQVGSLSHPQGIAVDSGSDIWVVDSHNNRVEELSSSGTFLATFGWGVTNGKSELQRCTASCKVGIAGKGNGQFSEPTGIAVDSKGELWVVDGANSRVEEFSPLGEYIIAFGAPGSGSGQFSKPWGIGLTGGAAFVADNGNNRGQKWAVAE